MAVSITMVFGRLGAVVGNLLFPVLFALGCLGPFIMIGAACLGKLFLLALKKFKDNKMKKMFNLLNSSFSMCRSHFVFTKKKKRANRTMNHVFNYSIRLIQK